MGVVWLVKHLASGELGALKRIHPYLASDPVVEQRFVREGRIMIERLGGHPNIVSVLDACLDGGAAPYLVMEYVHGRSLDKLLTRGQPMSLAWTAQILLPLCNALQFAHDNGVVHRDTKPSNVLLADSLGSAITLKVSDFGLSKVLESSGTCGTAPITAIGDLLGTPPYTSPEQVEGKADVDHRSDLYSVGVMLFQLLTGYLPFSGAATRMVGQTLFSDPPRFACVNSSIRVPAGVEELVLLCLSKDPGGRPQTARELAGAFLSLVDA